MAWYNPFSWFSSSSEQPAPVAPPAPAPAPLGGPYGGKKRKTLRKKTKRSRTGKKPSRP